MAAHPSSSGPGPGPGPGDDARRLVVSLGARSYPIDIGAGLLQTGAPLLEETLRGRRAAIVADERVAALHGPALLASLAEAGSEAAMITVPPGEGSKSLAELERVVGALLDHRIARDDFVIAFGGGVTGDLAGFAAAVLRRGVGLVQIPTTLLAQVDSSVGGKTGVNASQGKNLIGAFHQPARVLIDVALLGSLPARELRAGYAEVVKYGLLGDAAFFGWLEQNSARLLAGDRAALVHAISVSCQAKADIVARDERENGDRALLNLGHTFGHALEGATGYSDRLLHGEGVAIGMTLAFMLSARLGLCPQEAPSRVAAHLAEAGLPTRIADIPGPPPNVETLWGLMAQDKKVKDGALTFILARDIGAAFQTREAPRDAVEAVLDEALRPL